MKIIHTSDWHLGRSFGPISMRRDQEAFCDFFVDLVTDEEAELVVIAGDLYDRAVAPTDAIGLFRDTIRRLLDTGTTVAAITGNHDGADRAAPYSELLDLSGLFLRGGYEHVGEVITRDFSDGPLDLVLLPYLDPRAAPDHFGASIDDDTSETSVEDDRRFGEAHTEVDSEAGARRRHQRTHESVLVDAIGLARTARRSPRSLAVAHAFVTGGEASESEKALTVGGTGAVPATVFDGFSYVALGHLHRPQHIAGDDRLVYSGTPLAYSFSEDHPKSVTVLDLAADGGRRVETIAVPVGHRVCTIEGTMADLLDSDHHDDAHDAYVRAIITDTETVLDAKLRLAVRYPNIVEIELRPGGVAQTHVFTPMTTKRVEPIDAVRLFWNTAEASEPSAEIDSLLVTATARATDTDHEALR